MSTNVKATEKQVRFMHYYDYFVPKPDLETYEKRMSHIGWDKSRFLDFDEVVERVTNELLVALKGMVPCSGYDAYLRQEVARKVAGLRPGDEITLTSFGASFGKGANPGGCLTGERVVYRHREVTAQ